MPRRKKPPEPAPEDDQPDRTWRAVDPTTAIEQSAAYLEVVLGKPFADAARATLAELFGKHSAGTPLPGFKKKRRGRPSLMWKETFLENLKVTANVALACSKAEVSRFTAYKLRQDDARFAKLWEAALEEGQAFVTETLEAEAYRRAMSGSDRLLEFRLKALRPTTYRERSEIRFERASRQQIEEIAQEFGVSVEEVLALADAEAAKSADRLAQLQLPAGE